MTHSFPRNVRTWIEIDQHALRYNAEQFLRLIPAATRLMAVIKSNAYGHGLVHVAKQLAELRIKNQELSSMHKPLDSQLLIRDSHLWFGVDSIVEALRLRREGIKNPILVLGHTLSSRVPDAAAHDIILTVSNFDALRVLAAASTRPAFHLKIDTGMHRQGFMADEIPRLITLLKREKLAPAGIYTHFASAKDPHDRDYTKAQAGLFEKITAAFSAAGFSSSSVTRHAAASGGTLLFPETHWDMVRVGMGLYGYWPSPESKMMKRRLKIDLKPVLAWKTIIAEVKSIPAGAKIGYDETEVVRRKSKIAVLPIGYWHGYDRGLSRIGEVLVRGRRARVLGRVSMDMVVVDVTDIPRVRVGDEVVLIGRQGKETILAHDLAAKIGTTAYEFLTRINPLIKRVIV